MNRRKFNRAALVSIGAALLSPLLSFGKETGVKIWGKRSLNRGWADWNDSTNLNPKIESVFENYLRTQKAKDVLRTPIYNTVHDIVWSKKLNRALNSKDKGVDRNDTELRTCLITYMSIEIQYTNQEEHISNRHKAFSGLANLFESAVEKELIDYGCLLPCASMPLVTVNEVNRELILLFPCERYHGDSFLVPTSSVNLFNKELGIDIFVYEGELARVVIDKDGKITTNDNSVLKDIDPIRQANPLLREAFNRIPDIEHNLKFYKWKES